jgi:hypothetical protein
MKSSNVREKEMMWCVRTCKSVLAVGIALLLAGVLFFSGSADAQTFRGTVLGTVTDPT